MRDPDRTKKTSSPDEAAGGDRQPRVVEQHQGDGDPANAFQVRTERARRRPCRCPGLLDRDATQGGGGSMGTAATTA